MKHDKQNFNEREKRAATHLSHTRNKKIASKIQLSPFSIRQFASRARGNESSAIKQKKIEIANETARQKSTE